MCQKRCKASFLRRASLRSAPRLCAFGAQFDARSAQRVFPRHMSLEKQLDCICRLRAANSRGAAKGGLRACLISPRARLDGGFSAQTSLKTLTIRQDCCGFLPRWTKNPLANPHSLRYETGSKGAGRSHPVPEAQNEAELIQKRCEASFLTHSPASAFPEAGGGASARSARTAAGQSCG